MLKIHHNYPKCVHRYCDGIYTYSSLKPFLSKSKLIKYSKIWLNFYKNSADMSINDIVNTLRKSIFDISKSKLPTAINTVSQIILKSKLTEIRKYLPTTWLICNGKICNHLMCSGILESNLTCVLCDTTYCRICDMPIELNHSCDKSIPIHLTINYLEEIYTSTIMIPSIDNIKKIDDELIKSKILPPIPHNLIQKYLNKLLKDTSDENYLMFSKAISKYYVILYQHKYYNRIIIEISKLMKMDKLYMSNILKIQKSIECI